MNRKIFLVILALVFLLVDVSLSGKYQFPKSIFLFPILFFIITTKTGIEETLIPGLLYGILFDISIFQKFPIMTLYMIFIFILSRILKGKIVDISQPVNLMIFSIITELVLTLVSAMRSATLVDGKPLGLVMLSSLVFAFFYFFIAKFAVDQLNLSPKDEKR